MNIKIIGLTGRAGAGKNFVADLFETGLKKAAILSFASPLYEGASAIFGIDFSKFTRAEKEIPHPELLAQSPRYILQTLGTEWGRSLINPNMWIMLLQQRLDKLEAAGFKYAILPDVRFENEAVWVYSMKGIVLWVDRQPNTFVRDHASEQGHFSVDGVIDNQGTQEATGIYMHKLCEHMNSNEHIPIHKAFNKSDHAVRNHSKHS